MSVTEAAFEEDIASWLVEHGGYRQGGRGGVWEGARGPRWVMGR